jgi:2-aminoadipate transaminase
LIVPFARSLSPDRLIRPVSRAEPVHVPGAKDVRPGAAEAVDAATSPSASRASAERIALSLGRPADALKTPGRRLESVETISLARGIPAPECLPIAELADCARAAVERDGRTVLSYGPVGGYAPLRAWVAEQHGVEQERVFLTNGSLQGLEFLFAHLLARGPGRVLVEAPTYDRPLRILARLGATVVPVAMDDEGLDVDALEAALADGQPTAFLYTIPTFQNPSGRTLPAERRRRLVELARERSLVVVEDDPYGLVRYEGEAPPTLLDLDRGEHVVRSSSFSKTVAPGVRVGYLVLPPELAEGIEKLAVSTYVTPGLLGQATVWEFVRRGNFEPNLERVRGLLRARRDAMLEALEREFPAEASWSRPHGGYFVWLDLPPGVESVPLLARAEAAGVTFVAGPDFYPGGSGGQESARLAFSFASTAEIDEGVRRLAGRLAAAAAGTAVRRGAHRAARSAR